jgi:hypothetical protein
MLEAEATLRKELAGLGKYLVDITTEEFQAQGHNLTGASIRSVEYVVDQQENTWTIEIWHNKHMTYLNTGVPAAKIPYNPGSGAGSSEFIDALIRWIRLRRIASGFVKAKRIAFAIATTMKREGSPTKGAFKFSSNGRRTGWLDYPINNEKKEIEELLYENYAQFLADKLTELLADIASRYDNVTLFK